MDQLIHLGLFTVKTFVLVLAILILCAGLLALFARHKKRGRMKLVVSPLNEVFEEMEDRMQQAILSKEERKLLAKAAKKKEKERKKQEKQEKKAEKTRAKKRIFVLDVHGDLRANMVQTLREEITAILTIVKSSDEVFVKLESAGGVVHGYGLCASELQRIKQRKIPLIVSVDKVAASGGYLMACIADRILAAPFAIIGSIGVVAQLPNFHRFLKKCDVDFEQITAGEYKRTLSLFGENTSKGREKVQEEVEEAHKLFKEFIQMHRPQVDISKVSTGEYWYATRALELLLVDELITSDDYLFEARTKADVYTVMYQKKKGLLEKCQAGVASVFWKNLWV